MPVGRCEASFPFGGDLQIAPNGDFVVLQDTPVLAAATLQRIYQLIYTCAIDTAYSALGNQITLRPDDLFNPQYGSSIPRLIGASATNDLLAEIKSRLLAAFASDPGIATNPAPSVSVTFESGHVVFDQISVYDLYGNPIPIDTGDLTSALTTMGNATT